MKNIKLKTLKINNKTYENPYNLTFNKEKMHSANYGRCEKHIIMINIDGTINGFPTIENGDFVNIFAISENEDIISYLNVCVTAIEYVHNSDDTETISFWFETIKRH